MFARAGWAVPLSALLTIQAGSGDANAANVPAASFRFEYVRGAGAERCPDREALLTGVRARLGYDPFDDKGAERVRCEIAGTADGLRSRVETWDKAGRSTGVRALASHRNDCIDLTSALLLVLALASGPPGLTVPPLGPAVSPPTAPPRMEASAAPRPVVAPPTATPSASPSPTASPSPRAAPAARAPVTPPPPTPSPTSPPPTPAPDPTSSPASPSVASSDTPALAVARPSSVPTRARPVSFLAGAGAIGTAGALPGPSWGAIVTAGVRFGIPSLSLEGRYDAPSSVAVDEGGRIRVWMASLAAVPCLHLGPLAGCAIAGAGIIRGAGLAVPAARTGVGPWALVGLRAAYHLPLGRSLLVKVHADLVAAPVETQMRLGDAAVWTTPLLSGAAGLTLLGLY